MSTPRCDHMSRHGRCVLSPGHDDSIEHLYPVPATPVPEPDAAEQQLTPPAVGDRYVKRAEPDAGRIVTVSRVWAAGDDGHTAVAYDWGDRGQCGSACPLGVFLGTYEREAAEDDAPVLSEAERTFLSFALDLAFDRMVSDDGFTDADNAAYGSLRKLAGGEQQ